MDGLTAYVQWQSTLAYLKNPPQGYLLAGVDLIGGMQQLRDQVAAGAFSSEVDFQTNLTTLIGQAHDGHLLFLADALNVFIYERAGIGSLVSVSADGTSVPQVYALSMQCILFCRILKLTEGLRRSSSSCRWTGYRLAAFPDHYDRRTKRH
jgi:hypothetical protein